jgi:hypothetical protein
MSSKADVACANNSAPACVNDRCTGRAQGDQIVRDSGFNRRGNVGAQSPARFYRLSLSAIFVGFRSKRLHGRHAVRA